MRVIGIDLAWGEGSSERIANESGVVAVEPSGEIVGAGWTCGLGATTAWIEEFATTDGGRCLPTARTSSPRAAPV
jgi:hypothetical protein